MAIGKVDIDCDGCGRSVLDIRFYRQLGHSMRYCGECASVWTDVKKACEHEAARVQRLLDLWELEVRSRLPLKLTPLDMPALALDSKGDPVTLG